MQALCFLFSLLLLFVFALCWMLIIIYIFFGCCCVFLFIIRYNIGSKIEFKEEEGRRRKKQTNNKIEKADPPLLFYCLYRIEY